MSTLLHLARHSVLRIRQGRGTRLEVRAGGLWITQHGDRQDYFVRAGESFVVTRPGLTLVSALSRSFVSLREVPKVTRLELVRASTSFAEQLAIPFSTRLQGGVSHAG